MGEFGFSDEMINEIVVKLQNHVEKYIDKKLDQTKRDIIIYFEKKEAFKRAKERSSSAKPKSTVEVASEVPKEDLNTKVEPEIEVKLKTKFQPEIKSKDKNEEAKASVKEADVKKTSTVRPAEFPKLDPQAKKKSSIMNEDGSPRLTVKDIIRQRPIEPYKEAEEGKLPDESFIADVREVLEEHFEEEKQKEKQEVFNELDKLFNSIYQKPRYKSTDVYKDEEETINRLV